MSIINEKDFDSRIKELSLEVMPKLVLPPPIMSIAMKKRKNFGSLREKNLLKLEKRRVIKVKLPIDLLII